jgi:para-aminobenzoate synthetase/4-amino-4-deoxychorismate lyase
MYYHFPTDGYSLFRNKQNYVILETAKYDQDNYLTRLFLDPISVYRIYDLDELPDLFSKIEYFTNEGYYAAGYFHYECGYHFEQVVSLPATEKPIAWIGIYRKPILFNHLSGNFENLDLEVSPHSPIKAGLGKFKLQTTGFNLVKEDYCKKVEKIKEYIAAGDVYQINFTGKYRFMFEGSILTLYDELKRKQPVSYSALVNDGQRDILSFSPELFIRTNDREITSKPMKGTAPRGRTSEEDTKISLWLRQDEKNRAENLMIVDLLRNDLGRLSELGTVKVPEIFTVETYRTLLQMTSTVKGRLKPDSGYYEIFKSIFPCGSITGAPKIRAMQLITELEKEPRRIYTGAIGYFGPGNESEFNVVIRTLVIEEQRGEMGIGSGIVFDSDPEAEYDECVLKARFLTEPALDFGILEAIFWDDGYRLLDRHIKRLQDSANYFGYPLDLDLLYEQLQQNVSNLQCGKRYKVRLELHCEGTITIENKEITTTGESDIPLRAMISTMKTNSSNRFLYHKTTCRCLYDEEYHKAVELGFAEVIFVNEKEQITEGAISNVFIEKNGYMYTSPVESGLLRGVYRSFLLEKHPEIKEKFLKIKDLETADAIYICNSIRGLRKVTL